VMPALQALRCAEVSSAPGSTAQPRPAPASRGQTPGRRRPAPRRLPLNTLLSCAQSSARSLAGRSATSSPRPACVACGWAARCRSATTCEIASRW
jgi:hypothetical protein